MPFRRSILFLFALAFLFSLWGIACSWKVTQLKKQAEHELFDAGDPIDHEEVERYLQERYNAGKEPVWRLLGVHFFYDDLRSHALTKGKDMAGGRTTTVEVDYKEWLNNHGKTKDTRFIKIYQQAEEKAKKHLNIPFIAHFLSIAYIQHKDHTPSLFDAPFNTCQNHAELKKKIQKELEEVIEDSKGVLVQRLDPNQVRGLEVVVVSDGVGYKRLAVESSSTVKDKNLSNMIENPGKLNFYAVCSRDSEKSKIDQVNEAVKEQLKEKGNNSDKKAIKDFSQGYFCVAHEKEVLDAAKTILKNTSYRLFLHKVRSQQGRAVFVCVYDEKIHKRGFRVKKAEPYSDRGLGGKRGVNITLDNQGGENFAEITGGIIQKYGKSNGLLATVIDNKIITTATLSDKLKKTFSITGGGTHDYWKNLALSLKSGALPAKLSVAEENIFGPSLGKESQQSGMYAISVALLLVLFFMIFWYATAGMLANVALLLNLFFIVGTLAYFKAALTLAGIAGIVLTIGMAVDANVIIFEEIRARLRRHIPVPQAVQQGFKEAWRVILDGNLTTFITGVILYFLGSGPTRGFAVTLMIGVISSFVTAVIFFQLLLSFLIEKMGVQRLTFSFSWSVNPFHKLKIDFFGKRKWAYLFSCLFLTIGIGLLYRQGVSWGTEFTGGREYILQVKGEVVAKERIEQSLKKQFEKIKQDRPALKHQPSSVQVRRMSGGTQGTYRLKVVTNFAAEHRDISLEKMLGKAMKEVVGTRLLIEPTNDLLSFGECKIERSTEVGTSVAGSVLKYSGLAILCALLGMLLYILFSFNNFNLALAAVLALVHDVLALFACIGFAKLCGITYEVDLAFLSSGLTLIGYSINDTVVIFSALRKNLQKDPSNRLSSVANISINQMMSRTLITSFTTFLPLLIMYFFGGVALKALAFCLLCGVFWGTYSSVFIATNLACWLEGIRYRFRQRLGAMSHKRRR